MEIVERATASVVFVVAIAMLGGCSPPLTPYRNVAMVPAATMPQWDGRGADRGHVRLEGSGYYAGVIEEPFPQVHDSALRVPNVTLSGSAAVSVVDGLELGARVSYANYRWASKTATGTPPIPSSPSLVGFGPEIRGSFALDAKKRFTLGGYAGVQVVSLPYARWELSNTTSSSRGFDPAYYTLRDEDAKSVLNGQIAFMPTFAIDPKYGHWFVALVAQSAFHNDGFATSANAVAVEGDGWLGTFGGGYGIQLDVFRASLAWYLPLSSAANARYLFGGMLTLGVNLNVFGKTDDGPPDVPTVPPPTESPNDAPLQDSGPASF